MIPSPFHGIFSSASSMQSDDEQVLEHKTPASRKTLPATSPQPARVTGVGQVALDIFEYDDYYIIKAPIAGVRLSDIDIEVNDNVLTIRGQRRQTDTIPDDQYYIKECFWGAFERSVTLPGSIDQRKVKATFNKECILKVLVPKEERVKIIRISE
jgi:HSP20 family protein